MAQAKPKSSQQAARKRSKPKATKAKSQNGSTRSRPRAAAAKTKSRSAKPKSQKSPPKAQSKPAEVIDAVEEKAKVVEEKAKDAGKSVGRAAKKARVPLLASGAVIAGAAGGAALASRQSHRHHGFANGIAHTVRKIDSDGVAKAARRVGDVSARVGQFAVDLQRARESSNGAGNGNGRHRSPIEVVLQGLTARR
jgi:hypothetical protein